MTTRESKNLLHKKSFRKNPPKICASPPAAPVDRLLPRGAGRAAVQSLGLKAAIGAIVLQQVEHARHLRKDEHLVTGPKQLGQKLVEQHHFARTQNQLRKHVVLGQRRGPLARRRRGGRRGGGRGR